MPYGPVQVPLKEGKLLLQPRLRSVDQGSRMAGCSQLAEWEAAERMMKRKLPLRLARRHPVEYERKPRRVVAATAFTSSRVWCWLESAIDRWTIWLMLQDPSSWVRAGFVLKPERPTKWKRTPWATGREARAGGDCVPIRLLVTQLYARSSQCRLDEVFRGRSALPSPRPGKLGLQW